MSSPQSASVSAPRQTRQRAAPVRYREQTLENDLAPPKKKTRKSWIAKFDEELIRLNNLRLMPSQIAETLQRQHSLDPELMNRRSVESRLRYL
jgi:hypothetical protein